MNGPGDAEQGEAVCRCPDCGTSRVVPRKRRDHIDRMSRAPSSLLGKLLKGKLYHCIFCRLQFYSTKPLASTLSYDTPSSRKPSSAA
jgi:DNA-directed RNA polymerase subunit RPC12/RpoP